MAASGLSRNPIGRFFVNHVEKIVFGVGVIAVFSMLYFGMKTKKYDRSTPVKLSSEQKQAHDYMEKNDAWKKIQDLRLASTDTEERIIQSLASPLDHSKYHYSHWMATRLRTLGLRQDPELKPAQDLMAMVITAPIVIQGQPHDKFVAHLNSPAGDFKPKTDEEDDKTDDGGLGDPGAGGGTGGDFEKEDKKDDEKKTFDPQNLSETQKLEMPLNPIEQQWTYRSGNNRPEIRECVCVIGLVPYESQWKEFDAKLRDAKGWYPVRDRPDYIYIEIQRRTDGGDWTDITNTLNDVIAPIYADYQKTLVPEFVESKFLHPVLSSVIPPFLGTDYRTLTQHPGIGFRTFFTDDDTGEVKAAKSSDNPFGLGGSEKGDGKKADDGKDDSKDDGAPKQQDDPTVGAGAAGQILKKLGGSGPTIEDIKKEFLQELPSSEYKLVRFFDPTVVAGESYEYRVRVWLSDPNNPDMGIVSAGTGDGIKSPQSGGGIAAPSAGGGEASVGGDFSKSEGGSKGSLDGSGDAGGGLGEIQYTELRSSDLDPTVRDRIKLWDDKLAADSKIIPKPFLEKARATAWSEPTNPVKVDESPATFYAGAAGRLGSEEVNGVKYYTRDASISVMVNQQDRDLDVEIPAERRVFAGDLLNFASDTRFVHPLDWSIHKFMGYQTKSDAVVVGITGGERLSFTVGKVNEKNQKTLFVRKNPDYAAPGEVLIMDASGNFTVRNEMDDKRSYRHGQFARDEKLNGEVERVVEDDDDDDDDEGRRGRRGRRKGGNGSDF